MRRSWAWCLAACLLGCGGGSGSGGGGGGNPGSQSPSLQPQPQPSPPASTLEVEFQIDSQQDVRPISKFIYGMNFGVDDPGMASRPANLALSRSGGNRMTAYNWETNASNAGEDWFNQSDDYLGGGNVPGGAVTPMIDAALNANAGIIVTVPMIGYVAADKNAGGDVNQTPDYLNVRFHESLARKPGAWATAPDTTDAFVYQDEWVNFLDVTYPTAIGSTSAPIFFSLDNEPDLWHSTHPRLRGAETGNAGMNVTYADLIARTIEYASAIKDVDANAVIFGPVNYGWQGMIRLQEASDANDRDFLEFYLQQMAAEEQAEGRRLVDVLDVHWYPEAQGGGARITEDAAGSEVAAARKQAPRSLWDPTYTETSWITEFSTNGPIELLPRLQGKIDAYYPGTRLAITEYYYGGGEHISGGIAQADVLGILAKYGVFAAALWRIGETDHRFIYGAFEMFRNFDGGNGSFGDTSIHATTSNVETSSVYASVDAADSSRMVIVCINKADEPQAASVTVSHPTLLTTAQVYTLTSASSSPQRQADFNVAGNAFSYTMPANSVTTMVLLE